MVTIKFSLCGKKMLCIINFFLLLSISRDMYAMHDIFRAIKDNDLGLFEKTIAQVSAHDLNSLNYSNDRVLHYAIRFNRPSIVKRLLEVGVDPNQLNQAGSTPLMYALENHKEKIAEILLADPAVNPNMVDKNGNTVLIKNIKKPPALFEEESPEILKLLLSARTIDPNKADKDGKTPLFWAVNVDKKEAVELLLTTTIGIPIDPNIPDKNGITPLVLAIEQNRGEIVELLLAHPRIDILRKNMGGTNALDLILTKMPSLIDMVSLRFPWFKLSTPDRCAYLTFEQDDHNLAVLKSVEFALYHKIPALCSAHVIGNFNKKPAIISRFINREYSLLLNNVEDLGVIIPVPLDSIKNFILQPNESPESADARLAELVREEVENKYGFKNLKYVKPDDLIEKLVAIGSKKVDDNKFDDLIMNFKTMIDETRSSHPVSFFVVGHGQKGRLIASIPSKSLDTFFSALTMLNTQFIYIDSCYVAGKNLVKMQNNLQTNIKQKKAVDYAIVVQATSDMVTSGVGNLNAFFTTLNEFLEKPLWAFGGRKLLSKEKPKPTITQVINALGIRHSAALPSVRLPGTQSFFRAVDLDNMEIITMQKLRTLRLDQKLLIQSGRFIRKVIVPKRDVGTLNLEIEGPREDEEPKITIRISPSIKWIQIYPLNLHDCIFEIEGQNIPKFISKIPGQAQHYIGSIKYATNSEGRPYNALHDFIQKAFARIFDYSEAVPSSLKAWFIDSFDLIACGVPYSFKKIAVQLYPSASSYYQLEYVYEDSANNLWRVSDFSRGGGFANKQEFKDSIKFLQDATVPWRKSLYEATGGGETAPYTTGEIKELEDRREVPSTEKTTQQIEAERFLSDM